ncbi:MAG: NADH-quinone oxidoreductase subunit L, partial [Natronosporangium sp.]
GFFSKDPIIAAAFDRPGWTGWLFGGAALLGAGLTAFYMTRLFVLTFHGPKRWTEGQHPHESPPVMTIPLILLAVGTVGAGWLMSTSVVDWLTPVFGDAPEPHGPLSHGTVTALTMAVVVLGGVGGWALFRNGTALAPAPAGPVVTAARANLYGDAVNAALFEKPGRWLTRALVYVDNKGVDGIVNGLAAAVGGGSGRLRRLQTGFVRSYAMSMLLGALLIVGAFVAVQAGWFA